MNIKKILLTAGTAVVGALTGFFGAPFVFSTAIKVVAVEAGTTAATALYVASGAVAAVAAVGVVIGCWKLFKKYRGSKAFTVIGKMVPVAVNIAASYRSNSNAATAPVAVKNVVGNPVTHADVLTGTASKDVVADAVTAKKTETDVACEVAKEASKAPVSTHFVKTALNNAVDGLFAKPSY